MNLTESQRRAIEHDGHNLQLIACAGSGKTEVVARRVVHLLTPEKAESLQPGNIIAFTFTDKAAAELKERIVTRTRQALGELPGMAEMFVGTIHAFSLELLKSESPKHLKFEVLNEVQQGLFVDRNSRKSGLTTSADLNSVALKRYRDTKHYVTALSILREANRDDAHLGGCSVLNGLEDYQSVLDEKNYLDYSSILEEAVTLLTNDDGVRARLAERVKYVIVDEYQDVNPVQEAIVWSLHELGARICVVGDDDQTIYQWRGSDVESILTFEKRVVSKNTNELKTGAPGRFDRHRPVASPRSGACRRRCRRFGFPVRAGKTPSSNGMPRSRAETWIQARAAPGPERASRLRHGSPGLDSGPLGWPLFRRCTALSAARSPFWRKRGTRKSRLETKTENEASSALPARLW